MIVVLFMPHGGATLAGVTAKPILLHDPANSYIKIAQTILAHAIHKLKMLRLSADQVCSRESY